MKQQLEYTGVIPGTDDDLMIDQHGLTLGNITLTHADFDDMHDLIFKFRAAMRAMGGETDGI